MKAKSTLGLVVLRLQIFCISCILLMGINSDGALVIQHELYGYSWRQGNTDALSIVDHGFIWEQDYYATPYINSNVLTEGIWFTDMGIYSFISNAYNYSPSYPDEVYWSEFSRVQFNVPVTYALIMAGASGYKYDDVSTDCIVSAYMQGTLVTSSHVPAGSNFLIHDPDFIENPLDGQTFDEIRITVYDEWGMRIGINSITVDFVPEVSSSVMLVGSCCLLCRRRRLPN